MGAIELPAHVPAFRDLESTPARALTFATNLRAVTVGVKDAQGWAASVSAPDWEGETREAHDHATTRFAGRLDASEAALDRVVTAADRFEERLSRLSVRRRTIEAERVELNSDTDDLEREIVAATDASNEVEHRRRAAGLRARARRVEADVVDWLTSYDDAEADFIAALRRVDTVGEGEQAAAAPGRPDGAALARHLRALKADPAAVAAWWAGLTRAQRQAVTTEDPGAVGNTGGVPARDRDEANRGALFNALDHWGEREADGQLTPAERRAYENARHVRDAMGHYANVVDPETGRQLAHLLVLDPRAHSGDGAVAVSFGDPDTADHVSVNVPGLTSDSSSTEGNLAKTYALHQDAVEESRGTVASVYWLDYDAPSGNPLNPFDPLGQADFEGVAFTAKADAGGERFSDFIDGLHASDRGDAAHVTAIGHSYGSTAVGHALQDGMRVDDAVLIGSPGQPESTATALTEAHVWVGSKDDDPVSLLGRGDRGGLGVLGHDPADVDFGGTRFATGDGSLRVQDLLANHTSYFRGESLDNMAHIVTGNDGAVTEQPSRGAAGGDYLTLDELLAAASGRSALDGVRDVGEWFWEQSPFDEMVGR